MILHFLVDEKVSSQIIENFDRNSDDNLYLIFNLKMDGSSFVNLGEKVVSFESFAQAESIIEIFDVRVVIFHAFIPEYSKFLRSTNAKLKFCWFPWGYDIYLIPFIRIDLFGTETRRFLIEKNPINYLKKLFLGSKPINDIIERFKIDRHYPTLGARKKIGFFISYIKEDYNFYSNYFPNHLKFIFCQINTLDQYIGFDLSLKIDRVYSKNVLIGNSNTIESNHLDVFRYLKETEIEEQLIVPVSYGGDLRYKNYIKKVGESYFGSKIEFLDKYLDRKEYLRYLQSCKVGIFYHFRQQAMGNIIAMLYLGSRIYLSSKNPVFRFFKDLKIHIYSLDEDFSKYKLECILEDEISHNRKILTEYFSQEKMDNSIKKMFSELSL